MTEVIWLPILIVVGVLGLLAIIFGLIFGPVVAWQRRNTVVLREGQAAEATVVESRIMGIRVNGRRLEKYKLEVRPGWGTPYQAEAKLFGAWRSFTTTYAPGVRLKVMVDRTDPQFVSIVEPIGPVPNFGLQGNAGVNVFGHTNPINSAIYHVNGQTYTRIEDMPPDVRRVFEQTGSMLGDANNNGMPDFIEGMINNTGGQPTIMAGTAGIGPTEALQELKRMYDTGLITAQEYEQKKADILSRM